MCTLGFLLVFRCVFFTTHNGTESSPNRLETGKAQESQASHEANGISEASGPNIMLLCRTLRRFVFSAQAVFLLRSRLVCSLCRACCSLSCCVVVLVRSRQLVVLVVVRAAFAQFKKQLSKKPLSQIRSHGSIYKQLKCQLRGEHHIGEIILY